MKNIVNFRVHIAPVGFEVDRNLDVVMISAYDKPSDYHLLPWGNLREPLRNLKRAQYVIYTKTEQFQYAPIHNMINPYLNNSPISSTMHPVLIKIDKTGYHTSSPIDEPVFAFCGIANPNSFIQTVKQMGLNIVGKQIFRNHINYNHRTTR